MEVRKMPNLEVGRWKIDYEISTDARAELKRVQLNVCYYALDDDAQEELVAALVDILSDRYPGFLIDLDAMGVQDEGYSLIFVLRERED